MPTACWERTHCVLEEYPQCVCELPAAFLEDSLSTFGSTYTVFERNLQRVWWSRNVLGDTCFVFGVYPKRVWGTAVCLKGTGSVSEYLQRGVSAVC